VRDDAADGTTKTGVTEVDRYADELSACGVPPQRIIRGDNTDENVRFGRVEFEKRSIAPTHVVLCHKPYMLRRSRAAFSGAAAPSRASLDDNTDTISGSTCSQQSEEDTIQTKS
jgi:uncharacterized SAM-binding protein YcdF (DUF218 family)